MPRVISVSAANSTVEASTSVIPNDGTTPVTITGTFVDSLGNPVQGLEAAKCVLSVDNATGITLTQPTGFTDRHGRISGTAVGTSAGAKVFAFAVCGLTITDTASVTVDTDGVTLIFASDWSTATGTSDAALRDTGKVLPWETLNGTNTNRSVDVSTGLDFPSTNVLRIGTTWNGSGSSSFIPRLTGELPALNAGNTRYYRWYMRWVVPDTVSTWGTPHPIQDGPDGGNYNWEMEARRGTAGLKVSPMWTPSGAVYPNNRWAALDGLNVGETYRIELQLARTTGLLYTLNPRFYDSSNTLVLDASDFLNQTGTGSTSLASGFEFTLSDAALLQDFQCGTNGAFQGTTSGDHPVDYCYQGCFAISDETWCGAYVLGEVP